MNISGIKSNPSFGKIYIQNDKETENTLTIDSGRQNLKSNIEKYMKPYDKYTEEIGFDIFVMGNCNCQLTGIYRDNKTGEIAVGKRVNLYINTPDEVAEKIYTDAKDYILKKRN